MIAAMPKRLQPADLLEMLDLDERKMLAAELEIEGPRNFKDKEFQAQVSEFSFSTILTLIVRLRRPVIEMLQKVFDFLDKLQISGRTTVRAIVLPGSETELEFVIDDHLKGVVATSLSANGDGASFKDLARRTTRLCKDLESILKRDPLQWYNFYPFWDQTEPPMDPMPSPQMTHSAMNSGTTHFQIQP